MHFLKLMSELSRSQTLLVGLLPLKKRELFEGRDLNSTIDARAVYNSAMAVCFNKDPEFLKREVFWGDNLPDLTNELFKV